MIGLSKRRLPFRLLALAVLTICLSIISRNSNTPSARTNRQPLPTATQRPIVTVQTQPDSPLLISSIRAFSSDPQNVDLIFDITNVSSKPIRVYAIKQELEVGGPGLSSVTLHNLDLANSLLQPGQSLTSVDTYEVVSDKQQRLTLSVDYIEFIDGTKWGVDSVRSAERAAGQRAAAYALSKRLIKILTAGGPNNVMSAIEAGAAKIEPPASRSDEWRAGFSQGSNFIVARLKESHQKGGPEEVERKLRQFAEQFKGVD